jgi:hypothetical protein
LVALRPSMMQREVDHAAVSFLMTTSRTALHYSTHGLSCHETFPYSGRPQLIKRVSHSRDTSEVADYSDKLAWR